MSFERPKIACFICRWVLPDDRPVLDEVQKVADVSAIRVKCVGGVDPLLILEAFVRGVDGVSLIGCPPLECHFIEGSSNAEFVVNNVLKELLSLANLQPERLQIYWSPILKETEIIGFLLSFAEQLKRIGPLPTSDENVFQNLLAARDAIGDFRLRAWIGIRKEITEVGNVYGEKISQEEFKALLGEVIKSEFIRHKLLLLTKAKPYSVKELANLLNIKPSVLLRHVLRMRQKGLIVLDHVKGATPFYRMAEVR